MSSDIIKIMLSSKPIFCRLPDVVENNGEFINSTEIIPDNNKPIARINPVQLFQIIALVMVKVNRG